MKAKISQKKDIAKGTLYVVYKLEEEINFKPGQYFFITLLNPPYNDSKGATRHFSIVNSPNEKGIIAMATRIRDTAFKRLLVELPIGTEVEIDSIEGSFVFPENEEKPLVFIAGGIGITPFMSMLKFVTEEKLPNKITLIYSNKDKESAAFLSELQDLERENKNFKLIVTMTQDETWQGEKRRVDKDFIKDYFPNPNDNKYFISGPPKMVEALFKAITEAGVKSSNIKTENFSGY